VVLMVTFDQLLDLGELSWGEMPIIYPVSPIR